MKDCYRVTSPEEDIGGTKAFLSTRDAEGQGWFDFALAAVSFIERPHIVHAVILCAFP